MNVYDTHTHIHTWANSTNDSIFHFRICSADWENCVCFLFCFILLLFLACLCVLWFHWNYVIHSTAAIETPKITHTISVGSQTGYIVVLLAKHTNTRAHIHKQIYLNYYVCASIKQKQKFKTHNIFLLLLVLVVPLFLYVEISTKHTKKQWKINIRITNEWRAGLLHDCERELRQ